MRHGCGMRDQRLDGAEAFGEGAKADAGEEARGGVKRAEIECDNASESRHLLLCERVTGMGRQTWYRTRVTFLWEARN